MIEVNRRRTLIGFGVTPVAFAAAMPQARAQTGGKEKSLSNGARQIDYGEGPSIIPGFKTVRLRDIVVDPGGKVEPGPMKPMICHMAEGELEVTRTNPDEQFVATQHHVWTCNTGMTEGVVNKGRSVAVMRIIDLIA
jgi:hypothetical protein